MSGPGSFWKQPVEQQQGGQACQPHCESGPAEVGDLPDDLGDLAGWSLSAHAQAEQLAELTNDQDHCDTVQVSDEHGSGEVVRDPTQPGQPSPQECCPDQECQESGK
jgi:hypothetical protein